VRGALCTGAIFRTVTVTVDHGETAFALCVV
jgi:hypothetical protein